MDYTLVDKRETFELYVTVKSKVTLRTETHLGVVDFSNTQLCCSVHSCMNQGSVPAQRLANATDIGLVRVFAKENSTLGDAGTDQLLSLGEFE